MSRVNRIAELRNKQKLTQEQLSLSIGISRSSLSHYEKNRREPDYETLISIANYFKVSMDYLLNRTNDPEVVLNEDVREFVNKLDLSDDVVLGNFTLTLDGRSLTIEEAKRFIAFVRAERSL